MTSDYNNKMNTAFSVPEPSSVLLELATSARRSARDLSQTSDDQRRFALMSMADALSFRASEIVEANLDDLQRSIEVGLGQSLLARLKLDETKLKDAIEGVRKVALLPDPLGLRQLSRQLDDGLLLERITVPLGVLGVIFEARPDALIQIASLAIRSGNCAILKGGSEATMTNQIIMSTLQEGLSSSVVKPQSLSLLRTRHESMALLRLDGLVDLIIPRGSNQLVRFIQDNTRIPVLGHADGICHLYIDSEADLDQSLKIAIDSKTDYPAACNAIETLLIHKDVAEIFLNKATTAFKSLGVKLLGDNESRSLGIRNCATEKDWESEYLDLTLAVKIVQNLDEAVDHISRYGSRHTDAIATNNQEKADIFMRSVDSAGVFHNCSTRFADGFRYGFGAEVGISTQTLPPRGPVGLEGLVTYRYQLRGNGHIASDYSSGIKQFTHRDCLYD